MASWLDKYPVVEESAETSWLDKYPVVEETPQESFLDKMKRFAATPSPEFLQPVERTIAKIAKTPGFGFGGLPESPQVEGEPIRNLIRGVWNPIAQGYNVATEPVNALAASLFALPGGQAPAAAYFSAQMAPSVEPTLRQAGEAFKQARGIPVEHPMTFAEGLQAGMMPAIMTTAPAVPFVRGKPGFKPASPLTEAMIKQRQAQGFETRSLVDQSDINAVIADEAARFRSERIASELAKAAPLKKQVAPERISPETGEEFLPEEPITGEQYASKITSAEGIPSPQVRPRVDEKAPLRQSGETPEIRPQEQPRTAGVPQSIEAQIGETGISQRATEAELGVGSVEPGIGAEIGSGLEFGRDYINKGGDPRLPIRRALSTGLVGRKEVGIVHAELERLRGERNAAAEAAEMNPNDPIVQQRLEAADTAQRTWRKELQPVLTKAGDALREAYAGSRPKPDLGTYQGLADLMDEHFGGQRNLTPVDRTLLQKAAKGVKTVRDQAVQSFNTVVNESARKAQRVMTSEELMADLGEVLRKEFADCVL